MIIYNKDNPNKPKKLSERKYREYINPKNLKTSIPEGFRLCLKNFDYYSRNDVCPICLGIKNPKEITPEVNINEGENNLKTQCQIKNLTHDVTIKKYKYELVVKKGMPENWVRQFNEVLTKNYTCVDKQFHRTILPALALRVDQFLTKYLDLDYEGKQLVKKRISVTIKNFDKSEKKVIKHFLNSMVREDLEGKYEKFKI